MDMSHIYNPPRRDKRSKRNFRREHELALMEACHVKRVSPNEDLRAAFLQIMPEESPSQSTHYFAHKGAAQNASEPPWARSLVSGPSLAVHQETLDILEGLRTKQHSPLLFIPQITYNISRPKRHARIFTELISKANNRAEAHSPRARISAPSPLYPSHRNISSGTVASSKGSPTSIRYLITALNPPNQYLQHTQTPGTPKTPLLECLNSSLSTANFPESFSITAGFDGRELAKDFVEYMNRSSVHSQWGYEPDQIDRGPCTPVLERASSWAIKRYRRGTIHVAQALGLYSQSGLSVDADRCYQLYYCSVPSCKRGRQD